MQSIPLAVLKRSPFHLIKKNISLHAIHTACGIETRLPRPPPLHLQDCMQSIPLAVLKLKIPWRRDFVVGLHAIHTACGIETVFI